MQNNHQAYREEIAVDKGIDNTIPFLLEGYKYISNRTKRYNRKMFQTRLFGGKRVICMSGKDAAEIFYDQEKIKRHGATPQRVLKSFLGKGGVQTLDGESHRHRKELFMSLMNKERLNDVKHIFKKEWLHNFSQKKDNFVLYEEAKAILTTTACIWAGVPESEMRKINSMTRRLSSLYEAGGAVGTRYWRGRMNRRLVNHWMEKLVIAVRQQEIEVSSKTALHQIACYRDLEGRPLNSKTSAVEVINILRPIVAIAVYITFCALALQQFPTEREKLLHGTSDNYQMFMQEVRRYYPFFPAIIGKVKEDFFWNGHHFKQNTHIILDIYGTNHDPSIWENPTIFQPERFNNWRENPYTLIPQGGATHYEHHRCPGEWLTMDIMKASLELLVHHMSYEVPAQNLHYRMTKMPSTPKSGFIITNVKVNQ